MADITWFIASFPTPLIFRYHLPLTCRRYQYTCNEFELPVNNPKAATKYVFPDVYEKF